MINTLRAKPAASRQTNPVQRLQFGPACFAFDPVTGLTYTFSETAARIIGWFQQGFDFSQIQNRMQLEFGLSEQRATFDLARLRMDLKQLELLPQD